MSVDYKPLYFFGINEFHCTDEPGYATEPDDMDELTTQVIWHRNYDKLDSITQMIFEKLAHDTDETFCRCVYEHLFWGMAYVSGVGEINRRYKAYCDVICTPDEYAKYRLRAAN